MNKLYVPLLMMISFLLIGTGCSNQVRVSAEEIVTNVLDSSKEFTSYYAEGEMVFYENDEEVEKLKFEEYASEDGKRKSVMNDLMKGLKTVSVNDGDQIIMYEEGTNSAYTMDVSGYDLPTTMSQREQVTNMLDSMKDTHEYKVLGEENINGFDTYHLKLEVKGSNSLLGDLELWIDQRTWFLIKSYSGSVDFRSEAVYTKVDFDPDFQEDTFTIELPNDVEIESLDEENISESVSIETAELELESPFYLFSEEKKMKIEAIDMYNLTGVVDRNEVAITYMLGDFPALTLTIFPSPENAHEDYTDSELIIRGNTGLYFEDIRGILWDEDGLRYSITVEHPDLEVDDVMEMTNEMILSSEE